MHVCMCACYAYFSVCAPMSMLFIHAFRWVCIGLCACKCIHATARVCNAYMKLYVCAVRICNCMCLLCIYATVCLYVYYSFMHLYVYVSGCLYEEQSGAPRELQNSHPYHFLYTYEKNRSIHAELNGCERKRKNLYV